ncbi:MAG: TlpA family protein disulfide reductase [Gemmatimonadetes bacterium]|nr:TlpA family protein disulfide reductase [Gemmatimonadota bacterium]
MRRRTQWLVVTGAMALLVAALAFAVATAPSALGVGIAAPDFRAVNLASDDTVRLSAYRGQVVLLNLWATWCTPCEAEMPEIQRLYDELGPEGLRVVAVSEDEEGPDVVRAWVKKRNLTFDILHDRKGDVQHLYQAVGLPESFVIDRNGRIVKRVTGFILHWDGPEQKALFRRLLARKAESD